MIFLLLAAAVDNGPSDAAQSNWQTVGRGKDGSEFYIDTTTLEKISNDQVKIWTRRNNVPNSRYDHKKIQITFDCKKHESKYEAVIVYRANGSIAKVNFKAEKAFLPVIPNSADWQTMISACGITQSLAPGNAG